MAVGIVGTGRMGRALARAITASGQPVVVAPARLDGGTRREPLPVGCRWVPLAEVWRRASTVLLALPFPAALGVMSGPAGAVGDGRTLVDVTNPALSGAALPPDRSGGELIAAAATSWQVAKAFNTVPAVQLASCPLPGGPVTVPIAGSAAAKAVAAPLARRLGFAPVDAGRIDASRELESLAMLLVRISDVNGLRGRVSLHIGCELPGAGTVTSGPQVARAGPGSTENGA